MSTNPSKRRHSSDDADDSFERHVERQEGSTKRNHDGSEFSNVRRHEVLSKEEAREKFQDLSFIWLKYSISAVADKGLKKSLFTSVRLKRSDVLYVETHSRRYEICINGEKVVKSAPAPGVETGRAPTHSPSNGDSNAVDVFRWSPCKRCLPQKIMRSVGVPLLLEHIEVQENNLEWDDISWSETDAWIGGKEYHLARAHLMSPN